MCNKDSDQNPYEALLEIKRTSLEDDDKQKEAALGFAERQQKREKEQEDFDRNQRVLNHKNNNRRYNV